MQKFLQTQFPPKRSYDGNEFSNKKSKRNNLLIQNQNHVNTLNDTNIQTTNKNVNIVKVQESRL